MLHHSAQEAIQVGNAGSEAIQRWLEKHVRNEAEKLRIQYALEDFFGGMEAPQNISLGEQDQIVRARLNKVKGMYGN